jgi:hypothetical protein
MEYMRSRDRILGHLSSWWNPWGYIIYKSPLIKDQTRWKACRERFDLIVKEGLDFYKGYPGLEECVERLQFRWIEDEVGDKDWSVASIARYIFLSR